MARNQLIEIATASLSDLMKEHPEHRAEAKQDLQLLNAQKKFSILICLNSCFRHPFHHDRSTINRMPPLVDNHSSDIVSVPGSLLMVYLYRSNIYRVFLRSL